jgi:WD40 repeat protein
MSSIFISHSSKDNATAEEMRSWLAARGHHSVFLDFDPANGIPAGRNWEQELYRNIRSCRAVIVLCSEHSMSSRWCFMEITHARALGKHLFPVKIDGCNVDELLMDRQIIDFTTRKEEALQRLWNGILASGLDPADAFDWDAARSPFPGLFAFDEKDAAIFFGREDEIGESLDLLNRVRRLGQSRLVMILGASGSGKSSLLRAGLVPRLRRDTDRWLVIGPFRPRDDATRALAEALSDAFKHAGRPLPTERILKRLHEAQESGHLPDAESKKTNPTPFDRAPLLNEIERMKELLPKSAGAEIHRYLHLLRSAVSAEPTTAAGSNPDAGAEQLTPVIDEFARDLRYCSGREDATVLLLIDQFEELLGLGADHENSRFLQVLRSSLERTGTAVMTLGTMRSDFLGQLQISPALLGLSYESLSLGPMPPGRLAEVIEKPAQLAAVELEPGLVQTLLADAATENALPLLAFTLRELYERYGKDGVLSIEEYRDRLGGLKGAVAQAAEDVLSPARGSKEIEASLRAAFLQMVRMTDDGAYVRSRAHWDDLPAETHALMERFVQARLLVADSDNRGRTLEVAHEELFRSWGRAVKWLQESSEALRLRHEIQAASHSWEKNSRAAEYLWKGGRLVRARELIESKVLPLDALDREFIVTSHEAETASIAAEQARVRRELRRNRILAAVSFSAFLLAAIGGVVMFNLRNEAVRQAQLADSGRLASQSLNVLNGRLDLALLLSLESFKAAVPPTTEAVNSLLQAAGHNRRLLRFLNGHSNSVFSLAFSPDGHHLASAGCLTDQTFSPELGCDGWEVRLWDVANGTALWAAEGYGNVVQKLRFSTDGKSLASAACDSTKVGCVNTDFRLWDVEKGTELPMADWVQHGSWTSNERGAARTAAMEAARGNPRSMIILSDKATGRKQTLEGHFDLIFTLAFNPAGTLLASGGRDRTIVLWDVSVDDNASPFAVGSFNAHVDEVNSVAYSLAGERLASAGYDREVIVWDVRSGKPLHRLQGHSEQVNGVAFSPDGKLLASGAGNDLGTAKDTSIRLWDVESGKLVATLQGHELGVLGLAFNNDGTRLASAGDDNTVLIWDVAARKRITTLSNAPNGPIFSVAFSPDGKRVVSGNYGGGADSGTVIMWDIETGKRLWTGEHRERVYSVAFSPDGKYVASGSRDKTAILWDAENGRPRRTFAEHTDWVRGVAFSPDSKRLATAGMDRTIRLWDVETGRQLSNIEWQAVSENASWVNSVAFGPDGGRLAAAGCKERDDSPGGSGNCEAGQIRLWDFSNAHAQTVACRRANRNLTQEEWDRYLPGRNYQCTCSDSPPGRNTSLSTQSLTCDGKPLARRNK